MAQQPPPLCSICGNSEAGAFVREYHRSGTRLFHLNCWQPGTFLPLRPVFFHQTEESEEEKLSTERILLTWNRQFTVNESLVPAIYLRKAVYTEGTPIKRLLLEVLQYLTVTEVETSTGLVSKAWFHVSRDSEYWLLRYFSASQLQVSEKSSDFRRKCIAERLAACWGCNRRPNLYEIAWKCSYFQRPLCWWCSDQPAYSVLSLHYVCCSLQVSRSTLCHLSIPLFLHDSEPSCYHFHFESKVIPYANSTRVLLVQDLTRQFAGKIPAEAIDTIRNFDFGKYYGSAKVRTRVEDLLVKFCGGWREAGEEKTCVHRFARALKRSSARRYWQ